MAHDFTTPFAYFKRGALLADPSRSLTDVLDTLVNLGLAKGMSGRDMLKAIRQPFVVSTYRGDPMEVSIERVNKILERGTHLSDRKMYASIRRVRSGKGDVRRIGRQNLAKRAYGKMEVFRTRTKDGYLYHFSTWVHTSSLGIIKRPYEMRSKRNIVLADIIEEMWEILTAPVDDPTQESDPKNLIGFVLDQVIRLRHGGRR